MWSMLTKNQLWDVCSDQEAVELVRNVKDPQQASKMLVDHALSKFSTDNLSVMVVKFDAKKTRQNASIDIGVEHDGGDKMAISEAEMIINEARRHSGIPPDGVAMSEKDKEELQKTVIREHEVEQEAGPELTPAGQQIQAQQAANQS